jgi:GntR family transcriptional regulator
VINLNNQLDSSSAVPLYQQLANRIRGSIECGEYEKGTQIPTEAILSQQYGISRVTVRNAIEELTEEGILIRRQGKGTFVSAEKAVYQNYPFISFDEACTSAGKAPTTKLLNYSTEYPNKKIAAFLGLKETDKVIKIRRLRIADSDPVVLETDYFLDSFSFLAKESLVETPTSILNKHNIFPSHGVNSFTICYATEEESILLDVEVESPLLYIYSEIQDQNFRPIQVSKQIIRTELFGLCQEV